MAFAMVPCRMTGRIPASPHFLNNNLGEIDLRTHRAGEVALSNGLVDRIGGLYDMKEYIKDNIGEEVGVCW